jgi:hypothetical protein
MATAILRADGQTAKAPAARPIVQIPDEDAQGLLKENQNRQENYPSSGRELRGEAARQ